MIDALIAAQQAGIDLVFERAAAIDLAGRDVLEAVQTQRQPEGDRLTRPWSAGVDAVARTASS